MRLVSILVLVLWFCSAMAESTLEHQVIAASQSRVEAYNRRDVGAFELSTAEDLLSTGEHGTVQKSRLKIIETIRDSAPSDEQWKNLRNSSAAPDCCADLYIRHARAIWRTTIASRISATEVWERRAGRLVLAAKSLASIPVNHRPAIPVEPLKLAEYIGRYEWRPGSVDEISIKDGHLISRMEGVDSVTCFAAPDVNISADDLNEAIFQRNAAGAITGYSLRSPDGQTFMAAKLP
jgi:hypothetical protein